VLLASKTGWQVISRYLVSSQLSVLCVVDNLHWQTLVKYSGISESGGSQVLEGV